MTLVNVEKVSISLPKPAKRYAEQQARRIARERGEPRPNMSSYVTQLILRDRREMQQEQKAAA